MSLMNEPTIICPSCKTEIKLNESLAAPLIESTRQEYEQRIASIQTDIGKWMVPWLATLGFIVRKSKTDSL